MNDNRTVQLLEIPIGGPEGDVWNRLHQEREDICETLVKDSGPGSTVYRELLQARLRKIDDALDRLMSRLDSPLSKPELVTSGNVASSAADVVVERLNAFDTILLQTNNSEYRILLLDPKTGRALVEGGDYLPEPSEGLVKGSAFPGCAFTQGAISVGGRLEMWVNENILLTSPVKSVEVKHNAAAETPENIFAALHESIA